MIESDSFKIEQTFNLKSLATNIKEKSEDAKLESEIEKNNDLDFQLSLEQIKAISRIIRFINSKSKDKEILLYGSPGSGKTACLSQVIAYLNNKHYDYVACAPTHKAKLNLEKLTKTEALTLHQLLRLRPDLEIPLLNLKELSFKCGLTKTSDHIPRLIIIDECSMITSDLYEYIQKELIKKRGVKICYVGDSYQLKGVNEEEISQVFKIPNKIELTKIYRQADEAPLLHLLKDLKDRPFYGRFKDFESKYGSLYNMKNAKEFLLQALKGFKEAIIAKDPDKVKIITYTNSRIEAYNNAIHKHLFKSNDDYCTGEFLTGYDNFEYCKFSPTAKHCTKRIVNSLDYRIKKVVRYTLPPTELFHYPLDGYLIDLHDYIYDDLDDIESSDLNEDCSNPWEYLFVISKDCDPKVLNLYTEKLETTRQQAIDTDKNTNPLLYRNLWTRYFNLDKYCAVPFNLYYEDRLVKSATVKLGYAISTHKAQGSSIDNVYIDFGDLKRCRESEVFRQLEYVALSRTRNNIYILN